MARTTSPAPEPLDVDALLADPGTGIIVCCGSGGVGKTTTAVNLATATANADREPGERVALLESFTWHGLRHSALTHLGHQGATLADLMAFAGHTDIEAVKVYQHATLDRLELSPA